MGSRSKGARGEREAAKAWEAAGLGVARRGQQYNGLEGKDILVEIHGLHVEVKRTERFRLYDALEQAKDDACGDEIPLVLHRSNGRPWVAVVALDDLAQLSVLIERFIHWRVSNP